MMTIMKRAIIMPKKRIKNKVSPTRQGKNTALRTNTRRELETRQRP
jgi:hypothetical protein